MRIKIREHECWNIVITGYFEAQEQSRDEKDRGIFAAYFTFAREFSRSIAFSKTRLNIAHK